MFEMIKKLFGEDKIDEKGLDNAVLKNWINEEQKQELIELKNKSKEKNSKKKSKK